jgi:hypothetical protein
MENEMNKNPINLDQTFEGEFPPVKTKPMMIDIIDDGQGWGRSLNLMDLQETFEGEPAKFKTSPMQLEQTFEGEMPKFKTECLMLESIFSEATVAQAA